MSFARFSLIGCSTEIRQENLCINENYAQKNERIFACLSVFAKRSKDNIGKIIKYESLKYSMIIFIKLGIIGRI